MKKSIDISKQADAMIGKLKILLINKAKDAGNDELVDAITCMSKSDLVSYLILTHFVLENIEAKKV